jgi:energy-converting hydrogenase B subunit Q
VAAVGDSRDQHLLNEPASETLALLITARDEPGVLFRVSELIYRHGANITYVASGSGRDAAEMQLELQGVDDQDALVDELGALAQVVSVAVVPSFQRIFGKRVIVIGGGAQVGMVAQGAISEADRHNIRGERISVDTIPLVGEAALADAVRAVARLPRARALVLATEGDLGQALSLLDEVDIAAATRLPFELAWTLLVKGRLHRRAKERRAAADALQEALRLFEQLGAPTWVLQTRAELERSGLRRAPQALTPTELRVAELAAAGLTNREVAQAAFISAKTVEANLARVYRKLGIRSRAELGARMAAEARESAQQT